MQILQQIYNITSLSNNNIHLMQFSSLVIPEKSSIDNKLGKNIQKIVV